MMGKHYPYNEPFKVGGDDTLLPPYTRFWIDTEIPPEKIEGISMPWEFRPYNLQRIIDVRRYLYEKVQMGILHRVVLCGVPKTNGDVSIILEAMAPRAWSTLLRPGLQHYGEFQILQRREIEGKDHVRLVIPLREEEHDVNATTG